ncbi:DUF4870 domain-containing protein [Rothia nasimurium]|uniref:DUF4870 domain-containing protein n=1 Tax=Rothia nasimurium TaxID=85336 RepID=UPI001F1FFF9C|nr:DUF4870 domain-containing protein [Rothia nasimurium]
MSEQNQNNSSQSQPNPYQQAPQFQEPVVDAFGNQIPFDAKSSVSTMNYLSILFGIIPAFFYWLSNKDKPGYGFVRVSAANTFNFALLVVIVNTVLVFIPFVGWICALGFWIFAITRYVKAASEAKRGMIATFPIKIPVLS